MLRKDVFDDMTELVRRQKSESPAAIYRENRGFRGGQRIEKKLTNIRPAMLADDHEKHFVDELAQSLPNFPHSNA